jgi:polyphosphate kinase 2 (PPK2 family)
MLANSVFEKYLKSLVVKEGKKISLKKFKTDSKQQFFSKTEGEALLSSGLKQLSKLQDILYAENKHSVLIVLQAMDAAGKDGAIKHVMTGF